MNQMIQHIIMPKPVSLKLSNMAYKYNTIFFYLKIINLIRYSLYILKLELEGESVSLSCKNVTILNSFLYFKYIEYSAIDYFQI
jgi:hypothetical protein